MMLPTAARATTRCQIFGIPVDGLTVSELNNAILDVVRQRKRALVLNVNVHALNLAYEQPWFAALLRRAEIVFCDGAGVRMAAFVKGHRLPPRITYADWMWSLAEFASNHGLSLYFLGGRPGVAEQAGTMLCQAYPTLKIVGTRHGYFDKALGSRENARIVDAINAARPDILVVGFGMPIQEQWLSEHWGALKAHVALTGGAAFDYVSGTLQRPPKWMQMVGLEWLGRMLIEPARLWRRYVLGNPLFVARLIRSLVSGSEKGDNALNDDIRNREAA
jgi:N-acetylglucosaminyldiphosphoundecaprenol N-acetyl-beta-D-mannosaminyltransferase